MLNSVLNGEGQGMCVQYHKTAAASVLFTLLQFKRVVESTRLKVSHNRSVLHNRLETPTFWTKLQS